jgi:predicted nucleic acid-binding protein
MIDTNTLIETLVAKHKATAAALKLWTDLLDNPATAISGSYSLSRIGVATGIHIGPNEASNANDLWQWAAAYEFNTN